MFNEIENQMEMNASWECKLQAKVILPVAAALLLTHEANSENIHLVFR
jgi:hypothetical protein